MNGPDGVLTTSRGIASVGMPQAHSTLVGPPCIGLPAFPQRDPSGPLGLLARGERSGRRTGDWGMRRLYRAPLRRAVALPPGVLAATLLLVACQEGSNQACISAPFTARDSAGVVIATTGECDARRPVGWVVALEPDLELGGEEEPPFFGARGVRRLQDGTIAVLDGITREVRFFGEGGELQHSLGGRGRGPGEFVSPGILSRHSPYEGPDSLGVLLFDPGLSRLSWVSVGGSIESETFPPRGDVGGVVGYVGGRLLTRRRSTPSSFDPGIDQTGPEAFLLVDPWTAAVLTVAEVEVPRTFSFFSFGSLVALRFPFEVSSAVAVGRDRFWIVGERRSEVWEYDREGQLSRVLRIAESPRKATRRDLDLYIDVMQRSVSTREAAAVWDREIRGLP